MEHFLRLLSLSTVTNQQLDILKASVTTEWITITNMAGAKAPGPDGFTSQIYKIIKDDIQDTLELLYNTICRLEKRLI